MSHIVKPRFVARAFDGRQIFTDELSEVEFRADVTAAAVLARYVEAEETFRAVLDNYGELEVSRLSIAQEDLLLGHVSHTRAMRHRLLLDRRYANFLSSCRLYLEFRRSNRVHEANPAGREAVVRVSSAQYDTSLGYRVMEALRNYVQHRGFPLSGLVYQLSAMGEVGDRVSQTYIKPEIDFDKLRESGSFKGTVLSEVEALKSPGDLRLWTREYVDGLRRVHDVLIREVGGKVDPSVATYRAVCRRFADRIASDEVIVRYELRDEFDRSVTSYAFTNEIVEHVIMIRLENRYRGDVSGQFVTNVIE